MKLDMQTNYRPVNINLSVEDEQLHISLASLPAECNAVILKLPDGDHPNRLQDLLGHSSIEVTKVYTQLDDVELQEAHSRYSPVDDDVDLLRPPDLQDLEDES